MEAVVRLSFSFVTAFLKTRMPVQLREVAASVRTEGRLGETRSRPGTSCASDGSDMQHMSCPHDFSAICLENIIVPALIIVVKYHRGRKTQILFLGR